MPPAVAQAAAAVYLEIFHAEPVQRIGMIKRGVPAGLVKSILAELDIPQAAGLAALNLPPATVNRKAAQGQPLAADEGERVLGLARLIGQVQAMTAAADGFDAPAWLSRWLREPLAALGGQAPLALLDTMEGQALVAVTLARAESGAYG